MKDFPITLMYFFVDYNVWNTFVIISNKIFNSETSHKSTTIMRDTQEDLKRFDYGLHQRSRLSRNPSYGGSTSELIQPRVQLMNYGRVVSHQQSVRSQFHPEPENIPPPSTELEKSKMTR